MSNDQHIDYELLGRYFAGEASDTEKISVKEWAESNKQAFRELHIIWTDTGHLEDLASTPIDVDAAWEKLNARLDEQSASKKGSGALSWTLRIAAIAVLVVGAGYLISLFMTGNPDETSSTTKHISAASEPVSAELPDNSIVELSPNSSIKYPDTFDSRQREVELTGKAFFTVTHNAEKPFVVKVDQALITVLGTSFDVTAYESSDSVVVYVESGKVRLSSGSQSIELTKGMKGILNTRTEHLDTAVASPTESYWRDKRINFRNATLTEVTEVLSRVYDVHIISNIISNDPCRLTVEFKDEELETVLDIISATLGLTVEKQNHLIILSGATCQ